METLLLYFVLFLVGIIIGGIIILRLLAPAIGHGRSVDVHGGYGHYGSGVGGVTAVVLLLGVLFLTAWYHRPAGLFPDGDKVEKSSVSPPDTFSSVSLPATDEQPPEKEDVQGLTGHYLQIAAFGNEERARTYQTDSRYARNHRLRLIETRNALGQPICKVLIGDFSSRYATEEYAVRHQLPGHPLLLDGTENRPLE